MCDHGQCCAGVKAAEPTLKEQAQRANDFSKAFRHNLSQELEQARREGKQVLQGKPPRQR